MDKDGKRIVLRKLLQKDSDYMLEWMKDEEIASGFRKNFLSFGKKEIKHFIKNSYNEKNQHFAFVNSEDEYLGTVSLKNISWENKNAEFAIVTRKKAQGTGAAKWATEQILAYAFNDLKLKKIYLSVLTTNQKANKFYLKCGFVLEGIAVDHVLIDNTFQSLNWYAIVK